MTADVSVLLCCLGLGFFFLQHVTNAPYYLPTFTNAVFSEFGEGWREFGGEGEIPRNRDKNKCIALDHHKLKG